MVAGLGLLLLLLVFSLRNSAERKGVSPKAPTPTYRIQYTIIHASKSPAKADTPNSGTIKYYPPTVLLLDLVPALSVSQVYLKSQELPRAAAAVRRRLRALELLPAIDGAGGYATCSLKSCTSLVEGTDHAAKAVVRDERLAL